MVLPSPCSPKKGRAQGDSSLDPLRLRLAYTTLLYIERYKDLKQMVKY